MRTTAYIFRLLIAHSMYHPSARKGTTVVGLKGYMCNAITTAEAKGLILPEEADAVQAELWAYMRELDETSTKGDSLGSALVAAGLLPDTDCPAAHRLLLDIYSDWDNRIYPDK